MQVVPGAPLQVEVNLPEELFAERGAWTPRVYEASARAQASTMRVERRGDRVLVRYAVTPAKVGEADADTPMHTCLEDHGALYLPLRAVLPEFVAGDRRFGPPAALVRIHAAVPVLSNLEGDAVSGFRTRSTGELYDGLALVGAFHAVQATQGTWVVSPGFSEAQLQPTATLVQRTLAELDRQLGGHQPFRFVVVLQRLTGRSLSGTGAAGLGWVSVLAEATPPTRPTSTRGLDLVHELTHLAIPRTFDAPVNEVVTEYFAERVATRLDGLGDDAAFELVRTKWARFLREVSASGAGKPPEVALKYYAGPSLALCVDVHLGTRGTSLAALLQEGAEGTGRPQMTARLQLVHDSLRDDWLGALRTDPHARADLPESCLEKAYRAEPAVRAVTEAYLRRALGVDGTYGDGETAGAQVALVRAGSPLHVDDEVVAVDGRPVLSTASLRERLVLGGRVRLTVERGGARVDLELDLPPPALSELVTSERHRWTRL